MVGVIGFLSAIIGPMIDELLANLEKTTAYDLGQPYRPGIPHHPVHPPFVFCLSKMHGDTMLGEVSSAAECMTLGGHTGTHIDALCHFSKGLKLHGGIDVAQSYTGGVEHGSVDTIQPILRRGVLLDVAGHEKTDILPADFAIGADSLQATAREQAVEIRKGDVVLVRTGWGRYWDNPKQYINEVRSPGVNLEAAEWLSALGVFAGGSDTIAFELVPSTRMPVHVHLLVESGIHIIEALDLEELSRNEQWRFVFVAVPMKIVGGTGSPIRPIALV